MDLNNLPNLTPEQEQAIMSRFFLSILIRTIIIWLIAGIVLRLCGWDALTMFTTLWNMTMGAVIYYFAIRWEMR